MKKLLIFPLIILFIIIYLVSGFKPALTAPAPTITPTPKHGMNLLAHTFKLNMPMLKQMLTIEPVKDVSVEAIIRAADFERFRAYTQNLVENFSPRYHDSYQVFAEHENCSLDPQVYPKQNLIRALEDAEEIFIEAGYEITRELVPDCNGSYNLIAYKPARQATVYPGIIEIGAHLDAKPETPGAGDNATGVAAVMEIAKVLKDYPNKHPWRFIFYVEEENGVVGSQVHVKNIIGETFKAALVMDGIGWSELEPEYMNCIYANETIPYTIELANLFDWVRKEYKIDIGWRRCTWTSGFSDQQRYWEENLPAVLSVGGLPWKDPDKHKCSDNMANVDLMNAFLTMQEHIGVLLTLDKEP